MSSATAAPPSVLPGTRTSRGLRRPRQKIPSSRPEPSRPTALGPYSHPVAREMLTKMLATPIVISPEERYLCGHYLAYLLGGSRRRGIFLRRPLDARNADRARLLLAMTWLSCVEPTEEAIERACVLLEDRPDVRAALSPVVVIKYLASRDTFGKRKRFRQVRKRLQEASAYARKTMLDANGVLNPGMMPRTLDDLAMIAPPRDTLDAHRVSLWNRVAEVWRQEDDFRRRGPPLRHAIRPPRHGQRRPLARGRLPPDRACPLAAHVSTPARSDLGLRGRQAAPRPRAGRPARPDDGHRHPTGGRRAARRGPLRVRGRPPARRGRGEPHREPRRWRAASDLRRRHDPPRRAAERRRRPASSR